MSPAALRGSAVALAATSALAAAAFYAYGRRVRGTDATRALARLRRALRYGLPAVYLVALFAMTGAGWIDAVDAATARLPGSDTRVVAAIDLLLGFGAPTVAVVAAYLGAFPAARDLRDADMSAAAAAYRLFRYTVGVIAVVVGLVLAVGAADEALGGSVGLPAAGAVTLIALLAAVPWLVRLLQPTRAPTDAERERLAPLLEDAGLDVRGTVVLETADARQAVALVRGLPGLRYLLVSDYLLAELDDETLRARLALAAGRARLFHLEARLAAVLVAVLAPAAVLLGVLSVPGASDAVAALAALAAGLLALWLGRRLVFRVDDYAAERAAPEAVAGALRAAVDLNDTPEELGVARTIRQMEPPVAERIARLRAKQED